MRMYLSIWDKARLLGGPHKRQLPSLSCLCSRCAQATMPFPFFSVYDRPFQDAFVNPSLLHPDWSPSWELAVLPLYRHSQRHPATQLIMASPPPHKNPLRAAGLRTR